MAEVTELDIHMTLKNEFAKQFSDECRRRRVRPVDLMADIIETVIADNLFTAILDN
jgi:hypothetical protein